MSEKPQITTIKLEKSTKKRLERIRSYKRESYDEILQKMLETLNLIRLNPTRARLRLLAINRQNRKLRRKSVKKKPKPKVNPQNTQNQK